jgi:DNA-binding PadR family transcriptional regulator
MENDSITYQEVYIALREDIWQTGKDLLPYIAQSRGVEVSEIDPLRGGIIRIFTQLESEGYVTSRQCKREETGIRHVIPDFEYKLTEKGLENLLNSKH